MPQEPTDSNFSPDSESPDRDQLMLRLIGMQIDEVEQLSTDKLEKLCHRRELANRFNTAVEDFLTVVLTTPLIGPDEDSLRVELMRVPVLAEDLIVHKTIYGTDDEFSQLRLNNRRPFKEVFALLRAFSRSGQAQAQYSKNHWLSPPKGFDSPDYQSEFEAVIESFRQCLRKEKAG
jgi:hypothetical protein